MGGNVENRLGDKDTGTLTPKASPSANTRPDRNTDTSITTIQLSWYIWSDPRYGSHNSRRIKPRRKWWK